MIHKVTSRGNARIKMAASLVKTSSCRKRNRFLMEGPRFISDHMSRDGSIDFVTISENATAESRLTAKIAGDSGHTVLNLAADIFANLSGTDNSQGIAAVCPIPVFSPDDVFSGGTVLVLDKVADPGNAGTAIRSAAAFGCSGVVFLKGSAFPWNPKVTRSSAGLNSSIPVIEAADLSSLESVISGYSILAAESCGRKMTDVFKSCSKPVCLVIGSEAHGLSEKSLTLVNGSVSIPMAKGVESLNAGVSASILLSFLFRRNS